MATPFPSKDSLRICFAHVAYSLSETLQKRNTGISSFQVWDYDSLRARSDYDALVISGLWNNDILSSAPRPPLLTVHRRGLRPVPPRRAPQPGHTPSQRQRRQ